MYVILSLFFPIVICLIFLRKELMYNMDCFFKFLFYLLNFQSSKNHFTVCVIKENYTTVLQNEILSFYQIYLYKKKRNSTYVLCGKQI